MSPGSPTHSRTPSHASSSPGPSAPQTHRPPVPSGLRTATMPSSFPDKSTETAAGQQRPEVGRNGIQPRATDAASVHSHASETRANAEVDEPPGQPSAHSRLLDSRRQFHLPHVCGSYNCDHGAFSPRPRANGGYGSFMNNYFGRSPEEPTTPGSRSEDGFGGSASRRRADGSDDSYGRGPPEEALGDAVMDGLLAKPSRSNTTHWLAKRHGVKNERWMYLFYYIPCTNWIRQYRLSYLRGDLIAALTMASFYLPMALSYASNLAHIPPINGLYSFVFNPIIYALLGTSPQMVVGPEAAGSLLTGGVVKEAIKRGTHKDYEHVKHAEVAGMVTGLAGGVILLAGLCRLGFLDGVLSRPFLRGFISAIGVVIMVDQLIPEMGLDTAAVHSAAASHGSSLDKILFLFRHAYEAHKLTCIVSFSTIAIVLVLRELKRRLQPRMPWVAYIPERFMIVVLSAVFCWYFEWEKQGLAIFGDIRSQGTLFRAHFPFDQDNFKHVDDAFGTAFIIALLGFFESSVAAKSLIAVARPATTADSEDSEDAVDESDAPLRGMNVSANRELVALGVANLLGGLFMALPAFGGYGRSKVNSSTGGKTPMSSVFLSLITVFCILFLLPYFYYIPKGTLSAMISVVAFSLIEEAPHDIHFFYTISGHAELTLMLLIFLATFLWNLKTGIAVGIGLSLLRLLRHSTRPRIQILGRVPGTTTDFEDAEMLAGEHGEHGVEMVQGCLIVKIPEPLTFANTGSLKDRLRRLEDHGSLSAHPALPKVRDAAHNSNVIFDVHGVTSLDPAAAQVLLEIVQGYVGRGTRVFFCRVPGRRTEVWRLMSVSGIVATCGGEGRFLRSVEEALRRSEGVRTGLQSGESGAATPA